MQVSPIEVQKHLGGVSYPATKDDIVSTAEANGAPSEIVEQLRTASKEEFDSPADVMAALR